MSYIKLTAVVLKKQNYREADQIATIYSRELGKVRCVAKSLRLSKSKLSGAFQDLSLVEIELTVGKGIPVLISSRSVKNFSRLKADLAKMGAAFYAAELIIKLTPDEQPNAQAYDLLADFFISLDQAPEQEEIYYLLLDSFALKLVSILGFSIEYAKETFKLSKEQTQLIQQLEDLHYADVLKIDVSEKMVRHTHKIVSQFVEYIIERSIKSESFLNKIN